MTTGTHDVCADSAYVSTCGPCQRKVAPLNADASPAPPASPGVSYCTNGHQNARAANFCRECGFPITAVAGRAAAQAGQPLNPALAQPSGLAAPVSPLEAAGLAQLDERCRHDVYVPGCLACQAAPSGPAETTRGGFDVGDRVQMIGGRNGRVVQIRAAEPAALVELDRSGERSWLRTKELSAETGHGPVRRASDTWVPSSGGGRLSRRCWS